VIKGEDLMKKTAADDDRCVIVRKRDWDALVKFLRDEEETLKDSYGTPGKNDWEIFYKKNHGEGWAVYDAARRAAGRKPRLIAKR
jgi:hypothetical protein